MFKNIINGIATLVAKPLANWQERKTLKVAQRFELQKLAHEAKVAKAIAVLEMAKQGQQQDYDLDKIAMQNMQNSWKDELILVIFIIPIVMAFIPSMAPHVHAGFDAIAKMPQWYIAIVVGMVVTIYGLRGLLKAYLNRSFTLTKQPNNATAKKRTGHPNISEA